MKRIREKEVTECIRMYNDDYMFVSIISSSQLSLDIALL